MALVDIYALQTQYQNSEDEYSELMQNTKWLDPTSDNGIRAKQLNQDLQIILHQLIELLNKYKQPNTSEHYKELLNKYKLLQKNPEVDYKQKIKDNKILISMNENYVILWTGLIIGLFLLV